MFTEPNAKAVISGWPTLREQVRKRWGLSKDADLELRMPNGSSRDRTANQWAASDLVKRLERLTGENAETIERFLLESISVQPAAAMASAKEMVSRGSGQTSRRLGKRHVSRTSPQVARASLGRIQATASMDAPAEAWSAVEEAVDPEMISDYPGAVYEEDLTYIEREVDRAIRYQEAAVWLFIAGFTGLATAWSLGVAPWVGADIGAASALMIGAIAVTIAERTSSSPSSANVAR